MYMAQKAKKKSKLRHAEYYDMDIIPSDLATYGKDAKSLLKELQRSSIRQSEPAFASFII